MCVLAMSSAKGTGKTDASCSHVSSCFSGGFHRANARQRDEAKRNRAALRSSVQAKSSGTAEQCTKRNPAPLQNSVQSEIQRHCGVVESNSAAST